ncbi:MAG: acetylxylan esterase [Pirellulaceae bacterium]|nr:acetylxylan esterase [Pirellulaceae bacterium]
MRAMVVMTIVLAASAAQAEELKAWDPQVSAVAPERMLEAYWQHESLAALQRRREAFEALQTVEQCRDWQTARREFFLNQIGGLPERTPLDPQIAGRLEADDYRVEKIIFASRPNHRVTAALYLPKGEGPFPGVLIACGHSKNGKAAGYNQRMGMLLARHGMAALCYDPIGQGERSQILNENGQAPLGSTTEHFLVGVGATLVGVNTAQYRIYDGIRAIDYLISREDIDGQRIGFTGCSGGGTLTSYVMSLDDRVTCAAPACYITTFERLIQTLGPQDAEQNIFGQIAFGMEQTDYVLMRAPKPTLIVSTTDDYFDIQGSWDTFRQAKRFYARLGYPERVDLVEDVGKHGVTKLNRETLTHWMRRWLLNSDQRVADSEPPLWTDEQLQCTPAGQVLLLAGERSAFDLNIQRAEQLVAQQRELHESATPDAVRGKIRQAAAIRPWEKIASLQMKNGGSVQRDGFRIDRLMLHAEPGLFLPALAFVPADTDGRTAAYLYLHEDGKSADIDGGIGKLVAAGHIVLAIDLPGTGETRSSARDRGQLGDWKNSYLAYLNGRSLVGLRAENVLAAARFLAGYADPEAPRSVHLVAVGEVGVPALHAAALEPDRFASTTLRRTLVSWDNVVRTPQGTNQIVNLVHNALATYDLPDLVRFAGSDRVKSEEPVDASGNPIGPSLP